MTEITRAELQRWFEAIASVMAAHADELCALDAHLGDGDLGLTMKRGFGAIPGFLASIEETDIGKTLMKAGMKMAAVAPSTMGTLMASGIMEGGKALVGCACMRAGDYCRYLQGFAEGIAKRGRCKRGDCTVLDAIGTAADALKEALAKRPDMCLEDAAILALEAAGNGVEATRHMTPKFGKAAVLKAASAGEVDQGALAGMYMLEGSCNFICAHIGIS